MTTGGDSTSRQSGIQLEWRQAGGGWEASIVWAADGGNVKPRAYME